MKSDLRARGIALLLLILVTSVLTSQTRVVTDLTEAMPRDGLFGKMLEDAKVFGLLDTTLIEIDGTQSSPEALHQAIDDLGQRLSSHSELYEVKYQVSSTAGANLQSAMAGSRIALTDPDELADLLSETGMRQALEASQARLSGPAGAMFARNLANDPLDLGGRLAQKATAPTKGVRLSQGHFVNPEGNRGIILVHGIEPVFGTTANSPTITVLEAELAKTTLPTRWIGSHRYAAEAYTTIRHETKVAVASGTALVIAAFLFLFRSLRPLAGTLPALAIGTLTAGAAAAILSPIHGIVLAFGGALAGLGVDYWIHLYLHGIRDGVPNTFPERIQVAIATLRHLMGAYGVSVAATCTSFAMLATSGYPAVADLAWVGMGASVGAFLSVVLAGPLAFAALARPDDRVPQLPIPKHVPGWIGAIVAVLVGILAVGSLRVHFDGDPRAMDARLPETAALEQELQSRWGGGGSSALLVSEGKTLEEALARLAPAVQVAAHSPGTTVEHPLNLLPPHSQIAANAQAVSDHAALEQQFIRVSEEVGFDSALLLPGFRATLATTAAPTPETWSQTPVSELVDRLTAQTEGGWAVAAILHAPTEEALKHTQYELSLSGSEARYSAPADVAEQGADRIRNELLTRSGAAVALVLLYMACRFRRAVPVLAAVFPTICAVFGTLGTLAWLGIPLTPASGPALVLVVGLAFDQGIFLVEADHSGESEFKASQAAIVMALMNAFCGFAGLMTASHPVVWNIGVVVSLGIFFTAVGAFVVTPALLTAEAEKVVPRWIRRLSFAGVSLFLADQIAEVLGRIDPPPVRSFSTKAESLSPGSRRLGDNLLQRHHGMWVMKVKGAPDEMGHTIGELAGPLRERNEARMLEVFEEKVPNPLVRYGLIRGLPVLGRAVSSSIDPRHLAELAALTAVGQDAQRWASTAYTRKIFLHALHDIGQAMVDTPIGGCTGFVAGAEWTKEGHWLLARNWDFDGGPTFDEDKAVILVEGEGKIPYVHVGIVGLSGSVSGINAEGIAIGLQAAASDAPIRPGTPMIFIAREILENARSLDDVEAILDQRRGFVSEAILAVDGDSGEAAIFEVTPDDVTRIPAGNHLAQANHLRGPHKDDGLNLSRISHGTTLSRLTRMDELLGQGGVDQGLAIEWLRDRKGPGGLELPVGHEGAINADIASHGVVIDATARTIAVSSWPNLSGEWVEFSLSDLQAGKMEGRVVAEIDHPERTLKMHQARRWVQAAKSMAPVEAETQIRHALELAPGHPTFLIARARALIAAGRSEEARQPLEQAIATPPERESDRLLALELLETLK